MKRFRKKFLQAVSMFLALVLMISVFDIGTFQVQAKTKKKNVVVLYFSATGTTKKTAKRIQKKTGGKLIEIKAKKPYTDDDLDYSEEGSRVVKEHESASSPAKSKVRPKISNLKTIKKAVKKADSVYIGYPIWWGEAPHIVYTLVENVSLKGKTVVPFCTSASSGMGKSAKNLKKKAAISSKTIWMKGRNFYDMPSQKIVNKWIDSLNCKK